MSAKPIVKTCEVLKNGLPGLLPSGEECVSHTRPFERAEKAFPGRVVVPVSRSAPTHHDASLRQLALIAAPGIGTALVGVQEHLGRRSSTHQSHFQRSAHEFLIIVCSHGPAHDQAGKEIQAHRHIQPAFAGPDKGSIAHPLRIGRGRGELPIEQVGSRGDPGSSLRPTGLFRVGLAHNSISRIRRAVRSRAHRMPRLRNSAGIPGLPYTPRKAGKRRWISLASVPSSRACALGSRLRQS